MKKYFILAASAVAVLSSCSNEEISEVSVVPETSKKAIEISAYTPGLTRFDAVEAALRNLAAGSDINPEGAGFYLTAKYTADAKYETLMDGVHFYADTLESSQGKCTIDENEDEKMFYWPGQTVDFYAYHAGVHNTEGNEPCVLSVDAADDAKLIINIQNNDDDQPEVENDIMVAYKQASDGVVALDFKHVMAQVKIIVNYDSVYQAVNRATFSLENLSLEAPLGSEYNFGDGTITASEENREYVFFEGYVSMFSTWVEDHDQTGTVIGGHADPYANLKGTAMIPAASAGSTCSLNVKYLVAINGTEKIYEKSNDAVTIKAGYLNLITVTVKGDNPISVSATVQEWPETVQESNVSL
ncbi:MAG: fimbrillin family protein [Bacteroidales bacterium]|nr:fimbrillin family protein [Bacteroidales bacterium]